VSILVPLRRHHRHTQGCATVFPFLTPIMFPFPMPITTLLLDGLAFEEGCQFTAAACDRRLAKARNQRHANDAASAKVAGFYGRKQPTLFVVQGGKE